MAHGSGFVHFARSTNWSDQLAIFWTKTVVVRSITLKDRVQCFRVCWRHWLEPRLAATLRGLCRGGHRSLFYTNASNRCL